MRRKHFLTAAATIAAAAGSACAKGTADQLEAVEPASQFDFPTFRRLIDKPSDVRQLWDASGYQPQILVAILNALNGYQFGYGIAPGRISTVACLHGFANAFAYDDWVWEKYKFGELFNALFGLKDRSGNAVTSNVFAHPRSTFDTAANPNDSKGMYQDNSLATLQRRGVLFCVCHNGAAEQARTLVQSGNAAGMEPSAVLHDLITHVIPGAIVVPSAVATIGLLQNRFRYAYTTVTG